MKRKVPAALLVVPVFAAIAVLAQRQTQSAPSTPAEIGNPPLGVNALEFIGKLDQNVAFHKGYGYLTHIDGLADERLFSNPGLRDETTARFTFAFEVTLSSRYKVNNLVTTASSGRLAVYFNEVPAGNFNDPSSFSRGQPVASYSGRFHGVCDIVVEVNPPSPGMAIITMVGDLQQDLSAGFRLDRDPVHVGHRTLAVRLFAQAHGMYTQPAPAQMAQTVFGGNVVHSR